MKVALVYDKVNRWGGAERVLLALHEIWPEAPLFTSVYNSETASWAKNFRVVPSFLQKVPFFRKNHEAIPYLMPFAFEGFDFKEYDVVVSVTSEAAKGIITPPETLHICYCLTPTRYLWSGYEEYFDNYLFRLLTKPLVKYLRDWDVIAAQRPDLFIAISKTVRERIKKYYGRESEVIYPPVDINKFKVQSSKFKVKEQKEKYFLVVSRLVKYKRVDLAVDAFNQLGWKLKVVGVGPELENLKQKAKSNIEFLGQLTDEQLLFYYQRCEAVIFPQEEDFGIVPLEAMACGKPVIAYGAGGATETVINGKTGLFFYHQSKKTTDLSVDELLSLRGNSCKAGQLYSFDVKLDEKIPRALPVELHKQTVEELKEKILRYKDIKILSKDCREQAEKFNKERFKKELKQFVEEKWKKQ